MDVKTELELFEKACAAYAKDARAMRDLECDRRAMVGAFLTLRAAYSPPITHVCYQEGGEWIEHDTVKRRQGPIHAFKCSDGRIWDVYNGWRK